MFPYRDENETQRTPFVTFALIAGTTYTWLAVQGGGAALPLAESVCNLGLIPGQLTLSLPAGTAFDLGDDLACFIDPGRQTSSVVTSMFLHGSWMHLLGNMWFLWLFGNNIEDTFGRVKFAVFYLLCGVAAAFTQGFTSTASGVPMIGASGAISGVLGAYILMFPHARVRVLIMFGIITVVHLRAYVVLGLWFGLQLLNAVLTPVSEEGGVAFWAHVGGFVAGAALMPLFRPARRRVGPWG